MTTTRGRRRRRNRSYFRNHRRHRRLATLGCVVQQRQGRLTIPKLERLRHLAGSPFDGPTSHSRLDPVVQSDLGEHLLTLSRLRVAKILVLEERRRFLVLDSLPRGLELVLELFADLGLSLKLCGFFRGATRLPIKCGETLTRFALLRLDAQKRQLCFRHFGFLQCLTSAGCGDGVSGSVNSPGWIGRVIFRTISFVAGL